MATVTPLAAAGGALAVAGGLIFCCNAGGEPAASSAPVADAKAPSGSAPSKPAAERRKPRPQPEPEPEPEPYVEADVSGLAPVDFVAAPGAADVSFKGTTLLMVRPRRPLRPLFSFAGLRRCSRQPVVSVGNAGQLAVDMLLASLVPGGVPRVGFLDCPFVLPIAGHDAFASSPPAPQRKKKKGKKKGSAGAPSVLSVNVEGARDPHPTRSAPDGASPGGWRAVFLDKARGLTILQMRAPVAPVRQPHRRCGLAPAMARSCPRLTPCVG